MRVQCRIYLDCDPELTDELESAIEDTVSLFDTEAVIRFLGKPQRPRRPRGPGLRKTAPPAPPGAARTERTTSPPEAGNHE